MSLRPIAPIRHPLIDQRVRVPVSKSVANRELVLSALAHGRSRLGLGPLDPGDDVRAMREALVTLGYTVTAEDGALVVVGAGDVLPSVTASIAAGEAGTVARFSTALAALGAGQATIDGSARLRERPLAPLLEALRTLGARVDGDALPLTVAGPLRGGEVAVPGRESSQFASALLLIAPRLPGGLRLTIAGPLVSAPFVDLTVAALADRGVTVERPAHDRFVVRPQRIRARSLTVPGDATAATYPAAAAAILGGSVTVVNVDARRRAGAQGDVRFLDLLEAMGCAVGRGRDVSVRRVGSLVGITADLRDCSDVFPSLAVVAACAATPSELTGLAHTRLQESDRIGAVAAGLRALGAGVSEFADGLRIEPRPLHGGVVDAAGDHRVAMAFSVLGLQVPGVAIEGGEAVSKTFPDFYGLLGALAH